MKVCCSLALLTACLLSAPARAEKGTITGTVDKAAQVTAVTAINRADDKKYPGKIDPKTGQFTVADLPLGNTYDVLVDAGAARLEGVNLKVPRSDYEEEQPLTKDDIKSIKAKALELNQFEDKVEVMTVVGNIQHAAVILNKQRTKAFVNSNEGEVVWRLEVWHFEKPDEAWFKVQDELFQVLYRERLQKKDFDKKALTLDPSLGGIKLTQKKPKVDVGKVALPFRETGIRLRPIK
ncbi:MAG: hypothetical protein HYS12_20845 [Planctomycetes bacterium]|nr:hypothetical protein [Planctomycetota bacterium]